MADVVDQRRGLYRPDRLLGSHRITSRSSPATGLRQLRTLGRNTSEVPYRGDVEPRYSMAAEIPVEARSCRIAAEGPFVSEEGSHYISISQQSPAQYRSCPEDAAPL